jgi:hypothetical protein
LQSVISESAGIPLTLTQVQDKFIIANRQVLAKYPELREALDLIVTVQTGQSSRITTSQAYTDFYQEVIGAL